MIGGFGIQELLIVLVVALFLFGGKKLPDVGRNLGKALRGFKEGTEEGAGETEVLRSESEKSAEPEESSPPPSVDENKPKEA